jgi:type VI secretion system protein VasD
MRKRLAQASLCLLTAAVFFGCASSSEPKPKELQKLDITLAAQPGMNKDEQGRTAPLLVKVYELKSEAAFEAADFFDLQKNDKNVLQQDLLVKDEFILRPGDTNRIFRKTMQETKVLGLIAEFRDLPRSVWRVTYKLPVAPEASWYRSVIPSKKAKLRVEYDDNSIRVVEVNVSK